MGQSFCRVLFFKFLSFAFQVLCNQLRGSGCGNDHQSYLFLPLLQGTARLADEVGVHSHYIPLAGVERQTFKESLWRLHSIDGWPEAKSQVRAQGLLYNRFEPERGHTNGFSPSWGSLTGSAHLP